MVRDSRKHTARKHKMSRKGGRRVNRRTKSRTSRRSRKGGMLSDVVSAARTALIPFLLYKAQKRSQHRRTSRRGRTQKRRR